MNNNVKQILTSLSLIAVAVISFIIFAPIFVFLIIFLIISSFILRRKIMKENADFFKKRGRKKGRIIDQDENFSKNSNSNQKLK
ncbi:hypothetical protein fh0823_01260 [Francisella halioticida]|uniref:Uncharacterized protein n=1 Tax=Francisella halioticida TaxID=549298 RepID=A0ABM6LXX3_9GAMM|nr:DUF2852 domain-containing protein [Francisella halioticida]ASG67505.1 hypothetical protein CDV26_03065 [Francisella halioticida]BCD89987.1 hypothetical protein fh0823_01260 [Francisella halioticida]